MEQPVQIRGMKQRSLRVSLEAEYEENSAFKLLEFGLHRFFLLYSSSLSAAFSISGSQSGYIWTTCVSRWTSPKALQSLSIAKIQNYLIRTKKTGVFLAKNGFTKLRKSKRWPRRCKREEWRISVQKRKQKRKLSIFATKMRTLWVKYRI